MQKSILIFLLSTFILSQGYYNEGDLVDEADQFYSVPTCFAGNGYFLQEGWKLADWSGEFNGGNYNVIFMDIQAGWCPPCIDWAISYGDIHYEYADNNHVKFITALFEGDPDGNDDDSWPTCAEWGQLPGTNFDNLVSAQIVDDNDFGLFNMFNSQNSIPSTVWLDHEMRVHKLGNNLNAWHINYNINEMLESCGSLCDPLIGDVDGDGLLNIVDIIIIVDFIINDIYIQNADANNDNSVDIFDILILVNSILG